jgi:hypothetical protein
VNKHTINTPLGKRYVAPEILNLFNSISTIPLNKVKTPNYVSNDRVVEWLEVDGKLVTLIKTKI